MPKEEKHDGIPDLVVEFDVNELVASLGTVKYREIKVLTVNGVMNVFGTVITTNDTVITTNDNAVVGTTTFEGQDKIKISTKKCPLPEGAAKSVLSIDDRPAPFAAGLVVTDRSITGAG